MGIYVIQYSQDPNFVLGVKDQQSGAAVVARPASTPNRFVLWDINFDTGAITLNSSGGTLAIDPQGGRVQAETPLTLATYSPSSVSQRFDVISSPGFILTVSNGSLCVDNKGRGLSDGNPVWLYPFNGSPAQQWRLVPLMNLRVVA